MKVVNLSHSLRSEVWTLYDHDHSVDRERKKTFSLHVRRKLDGIIGTGSVAAKNIRAELHTEHGVAVAYLPSCKQVMRYLARLPVLCSGFFVFCSWCVIVIHLFLS